VVEFGCGTGRTLIPLIERGYRAIGVDLSLPMLKQMGDNFKEKFGRPADDGSLISIQANFVEMSGLADDCCDHGVCLFSTLGMIAGSGHRRQFLDHARRTIKGGGAFVLHAHNLWQQLRHPGGWRWFTKHLLDVAKGKCELGDRMWPKGSASWGIGLRCIATSRTCTFTASANARWNHCSMTPVLRWSNGIVLKIRRIPRRLLGGLWFAGRR